MKLYWPFEWKTTPWYLVGLFKMRGRSNLMKLAFTSVSEALELHDTLYKKGEPLNIN